MLTDPRRAAELKAAAHTWPELVLSARQADDLELLGSGALQPQVTYGGAVPLDVPAEFADKAVAAGSVALRDAEGVLRGVLSDVATDDGGLTGQLDVVELPAHADHRDLRGRPDGGFAVGIATGRPLHDADVAAIREPVLVLALIGAGGSTPYDPYTLVRALRAVLPSLPAGSALAVSPLAAGRALDRTVLANYGVTPLELPPSVPDATVLDGGADLPDTPPAVAAVLRRRYPPARERGFTLFFTGLSGSGKSTIAQLVIARLAERGDRPVTVLDGDVVRRHLSSELSYSREHRELNVRRVGFVAAEITRAGGAVVAALIAPYERTRQEVRAMVTPAGGFVLVHVATDVAVCEARDRKGLYARARQGLIPEFTGVSDPYEAPPAAEVVIDTATESADAGADRVLRYLSETGYLA